MSYRLFGGLLHLGVQRSSVRSFGQFVELVKYVRSHAKETLTFSGVMGYGKPTTNIQNILNN